MNRKWLGLFGLLFAIDFSKPSYVNITQQEVVEKSLAENTYGGLTMEQIVWIICEKRYNEELNKGKAGIVFKNYDEAITHLEQASEWHTNEYEKIKALLLLNEAYDGNCQFNEGSKVYSEIRSMIWFE